MLHTGKLPLEIRQLWEHRSAQQKAVEAVCSAAASGDEAALKVSRAHARLHGRRCTPWRVLRRWCRRPWASRQGPSDQVHGRQSPSSCCCLCLPGTAQPRQQGPLRAAACSQAAVEGAADTVKAGTPDVEGRAPLHVAAGGGHAAAVQALLDAGAPLNGLDGRNRTPLMVRPLPGVSRVLPAGCLQPVGFSSSGPGLCSAPPCKTEACSGIAAELGSMAGAVAGRLNMHKCSQPWTWPVRCPVRCCWELGHRQQQGLPRLLQVARVTEQSDVEGLLLRAGARDPTGGDVPVVSESFPQGSLSRALPTAPWSPTRPTRAAATATRRRLPRLARPCDAGACMAAAACT